MRLLHTADWHLGDQLGTIDRTPDQLRALDALVTYIDEYRVDVLMVAGDIIEDYRGDGPARLLRAVAERLGPRLQQGLQMVCVAGNHDRHHLFNLLWTVQALSGERAAHRVHFYDRPGILNLAAVGDPFAVQFVLAPYPTPRYYLTPEAIARGLGAAERRAALGRAFAEHLATAHQSLAPDLPTVLVAHVYVRGAETANLFRLSEAEDIPIEPLDLPTWAYAALGHLHRPQSVADRIAVRYAGSLDRLDAGERHDEKSVVLVEIDAQGLVGEPTLLPLPATPLYQIDVGPEDDLEALAARYPERDRALVQARIRYRPGQDNPYALRSGLQQLFPRCYDVETRPVGMASIARGPATDRRDFGGTVREYLAQRLQETPAADRDRLLGLTNGLIAEVLGHATGEEVGDDSPAA